MHINELGFSKNYRVVDGLILPAAPAVLFPQTMFMESEYFTFYGFGLFPEHEAARILETENPQPADRTAAATANIHQAV